jgi:hypothetical protein
MSSRRLNARQRAIIQVLIRGLAGSVERLPDRLSIDGNPISIDGEPVTGAELRELHELAEGEYQADPVRHRATRSQPRPIAVEEEESRLIALGLDELLAAVQNGDWGGALTLADLAKAERRWGSIMGLWRDEEDLKRRQRELTGTDG